MRCNYCHRNAAKPITADNHKYCGKLCAVLGLLLDVDNEDGLTVDCGALDFIEKAFYEGPIPIPLKVKMTCDFDSLPTKSPKGTYFHPVVIEDFGTPDWPPQA